MTYTKQTWADGPSGATPISADRLRHMEDGIGGAYDVDAPIASKVADPSSATRRELDRHFDRSDSYRGVCLRSWQAGYLSDPRMTTYAADVMERIHGDSVAISPNFYQQTNTSSTLEPLRVSVEELRTYIRFWHAQGARVLVKPHLQTFEGNDRAPINPTDPTTWWAAYTAVIVGYAAMCEQEGVDSFSVGSEHTTLSTTQPAQWRTLIAAVRQVYSGKLTYGANFGALKSEAEQITFWDALDYIGVDFYPRINYTAANEPYAADTIRSYLNRDATGDPVFTTLDRIADQWGRPIVFTEFGYPFLIGAADAPVSQSYLANWWDALLAEARTRPWYRGAFAWVIDPTNSTVFDSGTPTATVLANRYASHPAPAATADGSQGFTRQGSATDQWWPILRITLPPARTFISANVLFLVEDQLANSQTPGFGMFFMHTGAADEAGALFHQLTRLAGGMTLTNVGWVQSGRTFTIYMRTGNGNSGRVHVLSASAPMWTEVLNMEAGVTVSPTGFTASV